KLQPAFQAALVRQIEDGSLSATVGWITINRTKKLFLLSALHVGRLQPGTTHLQGSAPPSIRSAEPSAADGSPKTEPASHFAEAFDQAFDELDGRTGMHNFVSLVDLRAALPMA